MRKKQSEATCVDLNAIPQIDTYHSFAHFIFNRICSKFSLVVQRQFFATLSKIWGAFVLFLVAFLPQVPVNFQPLYAVILYFILCNGLFVCNCLLTSLISECSALMLLCSK